MMKASVTTLLIFAASLAGCTEALAQANARAPQEYNGTPGRSARATATGRIIVKWRTSARVLDAGVREQKAARAAGVQLKTAGAISGAQEALIVVGKPTRQEVESAAAQLARDPDVEFASPEYRRKPHALTNDVLLSQQWYLLSTEASATRSEVAWDTTQGSNAIVVAVLDTGVRFEHPDLGRVSQGGKLLDGYDFVSADQGGTFRVANDGNARDADASDPGDWVTVADSEQAPFDEDCLSDGRPVDSSWHGTRVAGLIGARTNNVEGVAGNAWNTVVLPVRVLGKCGGSDLDIIDGMRWAAGLQVGALPINPNPAKVINLSLGGEGPCTAAYQNVINEVTATGALVVASAGNEGTAVSAPANCNGVLGVAGLRHAGTKVGFSNLGPQVGIAAPGGNCVNTGPNEPCLFSIVVATNMGTTTSSTNSYTNQLNYNVGTSFSAPMAASAAALLRAVNGTLTPAQTVLLLKDTATRFPTDPTLENCVAPNSVLAPQEAPCNCTTETCGAGMLNTGAAIAAAQRPLAVLQTNGAVAVGATLGLNGSSSFASQGRTIAAYQWSIADVTGTPPTIANTSQSSTSLQISGAAQFTLRLTVTDDQGTQDTKDVALATAEPPPPPAPAPTPDPAPPPAPGIGGVGGGSGGGGHFGWPLLALVWLVRSRMHSRHGNRALDLNCRNDGGGNPGTRAARMTLERSGLERAATLAMSHSLPCVSDTAVATRELTIERPRSSAVL